MTYDDHLGLVRWAPQPKFKIKTCTLVKDKNTTELNDPCIDLDVLLIKDECLKTGATLILIYDLVLIILLKHLDSNFFVGPPQVRSVHIHPLFHACFNISGPLQKPKLNEWKRYKIENMCSTPLLQYIMFGEAFHFSPLLFLNPGKTDSTTGLWVQQTQSSKRKPQTQQSKVSTIIEQSDTFASQ